MIKSTFLPPNKVELSWCYTAKGKSTLYITRKFIFLGFTLLTKKKRYRNFHDGNGWSYHTNGKRVCEKDQEQLDFLFKSRSTS